MPHEKGIGRQYGLRHDYRDVHRLSNEAAMKLAIECSRGRVWSGDEASEIIYVTKVCTTAQPNGTPWEI